MKNSAMLNNSIFLIIFILVFSALLTCIASPPINILLNELFDKDFALSRVMSRSFMGFTIILLLVYRKRLKSDVGQSLNYTSHPWVKQILWGFLIGFGSLLLLSVVFWILGATEPEIRFSLAKHGGKLLKYLGVAFAVAFGEEIFFRGIVLQSFRADLKAFFALILMAVLFSFVHFLKPEDSVEMGRLDYLAGFKALPRFLDWMGSFESFIMVAIGLFLMGIAMGVAYLSTQSLFLPIGIHAGWIFFNKIDSRFFTDVERTGLLFGQTDKSYLAGTDSLIAWIMMATLTALLIAFGPKFRGKKA
jgi:CAAX protease family protein